MRHCSSRLIRWSLELEAFTFSIEYRPCSENGIADALSRAPIPEVDEALTGFVGLVEVHEDDVNEEGTESESENREVSIAASGIDWTLLKSAPDSYAMREVDVYRMQRLQREDAKRKLMIDFLEEGTF